MKKFEAFKKELLSDPEVLSEYEAKSEKFAIAKVLLERRLTSNLTRKEVAEKMGTSQSQVARVESGRQILSLDTVCRYINATSQSINMLYKF